MARSATTDGDGDRRHFLAFRHGTVRLGRITMVDSDLQIVDQDESDPFDFSFKHLTEQLVAGYARLAPDGGLTAYVPDFGDIERTPERTPAR
jgi:hypothetical protein